MIPFYDSVGVVLAAGGSSMRFGIPKLWMNLAGKPVFAHSLDLFFSFIPTLQIALVIPENEFQRYSDFLEEKYPGQPIRLVVGGKSRTHSVLKGLHSLPQKVETVVIHDAARPLLTEKLFADAVIYAQDHHCGVIVCGPVTDSIKRISKEGLVTDSLDRDELVSVQTPQVFDLAKLIFAYEKSLRDHVCVTDDAGAYALAGNPVHTLIHTDPNLKITYPHDVASAAAILSGEW